MTYLPLTIKERTLTLPREWAEAFRSDDVVAIMFGDTLVVRPVHTVTYESDAEERALEAVAEFERERDAGLLRTLGNKGFLELRDEAKQLDQVVNAKSE